MRCTFQLNTYSRYLSYPSLLAYFPNNSANFQYVTLISGISYGLKSSGQQVGALLTTSPFVLLQTYLQNCQMLSLRLLKCYEGGGRRRAAEEGNTAKRLVSSRQISFIAILQLSNSNWNKIRARIPNLKRRTLPQSSIQEAMKLSGFQYIFGRTCHCGIIVVFAQQKIYPNDNSLNDVCFIIIKELLKEMEELDSTVQLEALSFVEYLQQCAPQKNRAINADQLASDLSSHIFVNQYLDGFNALLQSDIKIVVFSHSYTFGNGQATLLAKYLQASNQQIHLFSFRSDPSHSTDYSRIIRILTQTQQVEGIILLDFFCAEWLKIQPFLLSINLFNSKQISNKVVVYIKEHQQSQIEDCLRMQNVQKVRYGFDRPFEVESGQILDQLVNFVSENAQYPQKERQDVVIFHASDESFIKKLAHTLRTHNLHKLSQIITSQASQSILDPNSCQIFVALNTTQLMNLKMDLSRVYLVLDYGSDQTLSYNYLYECFELEAGEADIYERVRRINLVRSKVGQYICQEGVDLLPNSECSIIDEKSFDFGNFWLLMTLLGLTDQLPQTTDKISQNIKKYCQELALNDPEILNDALSSRTYLPITHLISSFKSNPDLSLNHQFLGLITLAISVILSPNLQLLQTDANSQQEIPVKGPGSIWKKSGYLESSMAITHQIMTLKKRDNDVDLKQLKRELEYNQKSLEAIQKNYQDLLRIYSLPEAKLPLEEISEDQFEEILSYLVEKKSNSVKLFSGSKRLGYLQKGLNTGFMLHKQSLASQLSEKPSFIFVVRMIKDNSENSHRILMSNNISDEIMLTSYGSLGNYSKASFGECEIEFHGIPSAVIKHLTRYNGVQVENFENEHECSLEINESLNLIVAQCNKQKEASIRKILGDLLQNIKDTFMKEQKAMKYSNNVKASIGRGGITKNLLFRETSSSDFFSKDVKLLVNISKDATLQDLKDLFDEFVQLREINLIENQNTKEAVIEFYTPEDCYKFIGYFDGCEYLGNKMFVQPFNIRESTHQKQKYLLLEWNVWQSTKQGFVQFIDIISANNAYQGIQNDFLPHNKDTEIKLSENKIYFSNLNRLIDEKYFYNNFIQYGKIVSMEVKRKRVYGQKQDDRDVYALINRTFETDKMVCTNQNYEKKKKNQNHRDFKAGEVIRGKNGHRSIKIVCNESREIQLGFTLLDQKVNYLGRGRLYATPYFTWPIKISHQNANYLNVYISIFEQIASELHKPKMFEYEIIKEFDCTWMILKSNQKEQLDLIKVMQREKTANANLEIRPQDHYLLLSDFSYKSILQLENKYPCKFTADMQSKQILIMSSTKTRKMVQKEINTMLFKMFTCKIKLHNKMFRHFKNNPELLLDESKQLKKLHLDKLMKHIEIVGPLEKVIAKKNELSKIIQMKASMEHNEEDEDVCALCAEIFTHPYQLLGCGHKFCYDCLQQVIEMTSKDVSMFPFKCPQCLQRLIITDLAQLLTASQWEKLTKISVNCFIGQNGEQFCFCFTPQCPNIFPIMCRSVIECMQCKKAFCMNCKSPVHPDMTCKEARFGSDRLFKEFMKSVDGRVCPNKSCKAPLWRISGCYKVQCTRCKKCLCFKCPADQMQVYDSPDQAYGHLNRVHGGCF